MVFAEMSPTGMSDTGMYLWAGLLTVVALVASYFIAGAWQRWREGQKQ